MDKTINKKPFETIDQAQNYIHHPDSKKQMKIDMKNYARRPLELQEMGDGQRNRYMRIAIGFLSQKGTEGIYKKLLTCCMHGATIEVLYKYLNEDIATVEALERDAIKCVKDKISNRKIVPAFLN